MTSHAFASPFPTTTFFSAFFPKQCGYTEGFLQSGLGPGVQSRWYHTCAGFLMTLTAHKFLHLPFSKEVSHEMVAGRLLLRRARFTSGPCTFFGAMSISRGRRGTFGSFWGLKRRFAWQVQDIGHLFIAWQAWRFLHVAKMLAGVGQNERCFWRSFRVAGAIFGELGRRFERVENRVLWKRRRIWFGTWWWGRTFVLKGYLFIYLFPAGFGIISGFLVLCFPASLLFCFLLFLLLCLSACLLLCFTCLSFLFLCFPFLSAFLLLCFFSSLLLCFPFFSAFLLLCFACFFSFLLLCFPCFSVFLLLCFACFLSFLLLCFPCFSACLLLCFCAFLLLLFYFFFSSVMCFCCSTSCSSASLLPVFTASLFFFSFALFSPVCKHPRWNPKKP